MLLTPVGLFIFGAFTFVFVLAGILVDRLLDLPGPLPEAARFPIAIPVAVIGAFITGWSAFHFLKAKGTPVPFNPRQRLVCAGPFRWVRNPMLVGVFILLFGIGLGLNSLSLVLVFLPLYILVNAWELRYIEEPELARRFGEEYLEYRRNTPMFIPTRRHGKGSRI